MHIKFSRDSILRKPSCQYLGECSWNSFPSFWQLLVSVLVDALWLGMSGMHSRVFRVIIHLTRYQPKQCLSLRRLNFFPVNLRLHHLPRRKLPNPVLRRGNVNPCPISSKALRYQYVTKRRRKKSLNVKESKSCTKPFTISDAPKYWHTNRCTISAKSRYLYINSFKKTSASCWGLFFGILFLALTCNFLATRDLCADFGDNFEPISDAGKIIFWIGFEFFLELIKCEYF